MGTIKIALNELFKAAGELKDEPVFNNLVDYMKKLEVKMLGLFETRSLLRAPAYAAESIVEEKRAQNERNEKRRDQLKEQQIANDRDKQLRAAEKAENREKLLQRAGKRPKARSEKQKHKTQNFKKVEID